MPRERSQSHVISQQRACSQALVRLQLSISKTWPRWAPASINIRILLRLSIQSKLSSDQCLSQLPAARTYVRLRGYSAYVNASTFICESLGRSSCSIVKCSMTLLPFDPLKPVAKGSEHFVELSCSANATLADEKTGIPHPYTCSFIRNCFACLGKIKWIKK